MPYERLFADEDRRHDRLVALAADQVEREADQRQLEHHQVALEVGEARAGEARRRPPCRSGPARRRSRGGRGARSRSSAARRPRAGRPRPPRSSRPGRRGRAGWAARRRPASSSASTCSSSALPDSIVSFSPATAAICSVGILAALLGLADLLGERLALGLGALDLGQQLAAAGVEAEQLVDLLGGAAAGQRRLDPLGIGADQLQVEHRSRPARARCWPGRGDSSASPPAYLATKRATALASSPTTMFWGMIAPGETAVLDREESVVIGLGSLVEVRTLRAQAAIAAALGAGGAQRVAARAVRGEEHGPAVVGVVLGDRDRLLRRNRRRRARGRRREPWLMSSAGRTRRASYCLEPIAL